MLFRSAIDGEVRAATSCVARCAVAGDADARRQRPRSRMVAPLGRLSVRGEKRTARTVPGHVRGAYPARRVRFCRPRTRCRSAGMPRSPRPMRSTGGNAAGSAKGRPARERVHSGTFAVKTDPGRAMYRAPRRSAFATPDLFVRRGGRLVHACLDGIPLGAVPALSRAEPLGDTARSMTEAQTGRMRAHQRARMCGPAQGHPEVGDIPLIRPVFQRQSE